MSAPNSYIAQDLLTLCLRLCLEPAESHSPDTLAVLDRWRPAWEAAAGGMPMEEAIRQVSSITGPDLLECQRVLSLILTRLDDGEWMPTEYKDMARDCIKGSPFATPNQEGIKS